MKNQLSMQDQFLNRIRRDKIRVVISLVDGGQLEGEVTSFDNFSLLLRGEGDQLVYKHAIATISAGAKLEPLEK
jgi:host factor-I protein